MAIPQILSTISTTAQKMNTRPLDITSKLLGAGTIASVIYDSHFNGKSKSVVKDRIETAERLEDNYKQYITLDKRSQTIADLKNYWYDMQQKFSLFHVYSKTTGYISGATQTLLANLPELALSVLALKTRKHKILGNAAGIALALNAVKTIVHDVIGSDK